MRRLAMVLAALCGISPAGAEFLFNPDRQTPNGLLLPTLDYDNTVYEYSAWDVFYAPHTVGNYPDLFAPYGGRDTGSGWAPETRTSANTNPDAQKPAGGFASSPYYNPSNALAFWDTRNATITQTATSAFIIGPDISGNIYTFSEKTNYVLANDPDYDQLGSVIFQFQTDGSLVDFSSIKLVYSDGFNTYEISALDAEYLREFHTTGGSHWSAAGGYSNRVAIQWDLSGLTDPFGNAITSYEIHWTASSSSMSLQKVDLVTADTYEAGIPISAAWQGAGGLWSDDSQWTLNEHSGLSGAQQNGNIKFQNAGDITVQLDEDFSLGELIFETGNDVTISPVGAEKLLSNTGVTTREAATGTYTVNADVEFGALNFFDIAAGTVVMNGRLSGDYGMVKSGAGTLVLANDNSFTGFLGVQGGTVRIEGANTYGGATTVINGRLEVAGDAGATGALGSSTSAIQIGADQSLYEYVGSADWLAELMIDGNHEISRDVQLAPGDFAKRIGSVNSSGGAEFSGGIFFTGSAADTDLENPDTAAGNVYLTAVNSSDRLVFRGSMTGGASAKTVTLDGAGTVVYEGAVKTYANSTIVQSGVLLLGAGSGYAGNGNLSVRSGATLRVDGTLGGDGSLQVEGGRIEGSGEIRRALTIDAGDVIAPGNGVDRLDTAGQTWGGGGAYLWEVGSLSGGAGGGWDLLNISGTLTMTATEASPFEIRIVSLDGEGLSGLLAGFDPALSYEWIIATASEGIIGFDPALVSISAAGFLNDHAGVFGLEQDGGSLVLTYTAVPEPSAATLLAAGLAGLALPLLRRFRAAYKTK